MSVMTKAHFAEFRAHRGPPPGYDHENDPDDYRGGPEPYSGGCLACHQQDGTCDDCYEEHQAAIKDNDTACTACGEHLGLYNGLCRNCGQSFEDAVARAD